MERRKGSYAADAYFCVNKEFFCDIIRLRAAYYGKLDVLLTQTLILRDWEIITKIVCLLED